MEEVSYLRFIVSFIFIVGLIIFSAALFKKFAIDRKLIGSMSKRRLTVTEAISLDGKRRLFLVKRDSTEHLILVGGGNDIVIESNIKPEVSE